MGLKLGLDPPLPTNLNGKWTTRVVDGRNGAETLIRTQRSRIWEKEAKMGGKCPHRSVKKRRYSHKAARRTKFLVKDILFLSLDQF
ncbi:hypothetical protein PanWU01x14_233260 [Parasponia andersonii]|uniref:Uncharacterized protein n=1 Tax=Parasponia andersonii TaxID=3476 RepID=A0A2P5BJU4_PARAD|nr:hypothetical protein PanWU01x14_233260 [Parasponia andersonii]